MEKLEPVRNHSLQCCYAKKFIPRTYVIDKTGKIAHQSMGCTPADFKHLVEAVGKAATD